MSRIIENTNKIDQVEVEGINTADHPDYVDAFICAADYDGVPLTDEDLTALNKNRDFVIKCVTDKIF